MAVERNKTQPEFNQDEAVRQQGPALYMPAMPPLGLQRMIGRWLRRRRRGAGSASLSSLNDHLLSDIGVPKRDRSRLTERQLAAFYEQPLGRAAGSYTERRGAPAEHHSLRRARRETLQ